MNLTKCISRNQQEPRLNGGSTERPSRLRISSKERARVASDSNGKSDALMSVNSVLVTREQSRKHWKSGLGLQTRRLPEKGPRLWGVAGLGKAGVVWALAQKRTKPHQAYNEPVSLFQCYWLLAAECRAYFLRGTLRVRVQNDHHSSTTVLVRQSPNSHTICSQHRRPGSKYGNFERKVLLLL